MDTVQLGRRWALAAEIEDMKRERAALDVYIRHITKRLAEDAVPFREDPRPH